MELSWYIPSVVEVRLVPSEKIPRELLTSSARMPAGLMIDMFQFMTSWVKADVSSECPFLAMRCVILALSETWTLNLMIEKCGQTPMKTPNGHNMQVFHGPVLDHQPHVPNRLQPIPRLGTQLTWKVNCGSKELKLKLVFPRAELTKQTWNFDKHSSESSSRIAG